MKKVLDLERLSGSENEFIARILKGGRESVAAVVPDDMEPREVLAAIRSCVSADVELESIRGRIAPVLGRLMALLAGNPEILEKSGYTTIKEFEEAELIQKGISHGTLWASKAVYTVFPALSLDQYGKIGTVNLGNAARALKGKDASPAQKQRVLKEAEERTGEGFKQYLVESGLVTQGELAGASFVLTGNKDQMEEFESYLANPFLQEAAGSHHALTLVLACMRESSSEWEKQAEEVRGALTVVVSGTVPCVRRCLHPAMSAGMARRLVASHPRRSIQVAGCSAVTLLAAAEEAW